MIYFTENKEKIEINAHSKKSGGEGNVHNIIYPAELRSYRVKIYHKEKAFERYEKIRYMISNPPKTLRKDKFNICWPKKILKNPNGEFSGFIMDNAEGTELYQIATLSKTSRLGPEWIKKFNRSDNECVIRMLKVIVNIASAFNEIHKTKKYVLIDIKPQNIMVNLTGGISIIDVDSIQITENGSILHPGKVGTPEYSPPDFTEPISEQWDRFSMGVVFYELLFGINPFAGTFVKPYNSCNVIEERIKNGLLVVGFGNKYLSVKPNLHNNFDKIPRTIQDLFLRALDSKKFPSSSRPSAEEWGKTLHNEINKLSSAKNFGFYVHTPSIKKKDTVNRKTKSFTKTTHQPHSAPSNYSYQQTFHQPAPYPTSSGTTYYPGSSDTFWRIFKITLSLIIIITILYFLVTFCKSLFSSKEDTPVVTQQYRQQVIDNTGPALIANSWLNSLNNKDFKTAWNLMSGDKRGSYQQFYKGYGNIKNIYVHTCVNLTYDNSNGRVEVFYDAYDPVNDPRNGNCSNCFGRYHKVFVLKKIKGSWKIVNIQNNYSNSIQFYDLSSFGK